MRASAGDFGSRHRRVDERDDKRNLFATSPQISMNMINSVKPFRSRFVVTTLKMGSEPIIFQTSHDTASLQPNMVIASFAKKRPPKDVSCTPKASQSPHTAHSNLKLQKWFVHICFIMTA
jgi:hypothetical protein